MKRTCQRLQRILADDGPTALRDDAAAQEHLAECPDCFVVLEGLAELDAALAELPSYDAPDDIVKSLLARPELGRPETGAPRSVQARLSSRVSRFKTVLRRPLAGLPRVRGPRIRGQWVAAAAALLAVTVGLRIWTTSPRRYLGATAVRVIQEPGPLPLPATPELPSPVGKKQDKARADVDAVTVGDREKEAPEQKIVETIEVTSESPLLDSRKTSAADVTPVAELEAIPSARDPRAIETVPDTQTGRIGAESSDAPASGVRLNIVTRRGANELRGSGLSYRVEEGQEEANWAVDGVVITDMSATGASPSYYNFDDFNELTVGKDADSGRTPRQRAEDFLRRLSLLEGLRYQGATGYWSNSYVPGDPALRHLQARLLGADRGAFEAGSESELRLHDASRRTTQPFDAPANAALAVYLHADRQQIRGETRLLVQVGLRGTERRGGRRAPMNVSLVLDAGGEVTAQSAATLRALVLAFAQACQPGDRFRLVVAGRSGGLVVGPEDFRHGPLTVALERLFADDPEPTEPALGLADALRTAVTEASHAEDPDAPLGSSAVVLLTSRSLGADLEVLRQLAHTSAVAGVPVSVAGAGSGVELDELDTIALAGQGHRRLIQAPREAPALVERELSAVSRVIARAVRLRIRLAPGVRLVEVLGSRRLDTVRAEEVREAERGIDRRLSRSLGIAADRGEDEDGIQIVVPSFYSGDSHVVLLDVVAPGPGPVADVRVRYKDLVHLENGQARARLTLRRGDPPEGASWSGGPLERNVLKNLLAVRLHEVLEAAGEAVTAGDSAGALRRLNTFRQLLEGLSVEVPGFDQDADVERDAAMLAEYVRLLETADQPGQLRLLGESLRYAGLLKVLPRPQPAEGNP